MDPKSYDQALQELQQIVDQIQSPEMSLDELGPRVERAKELISYCRERLRHVEAKVDELNKEDE